jgi:hypothetical protein
MRVCPVTAAIRLWYNRRKLIRQEVMDMGRGILLWLLGVPIPIIILLAMCSHH